MKTWACACSCVDRFLSIWKYTYARGLYVCLFSILWFFKHKSHAVCNNYFVNWLLTLQQFLKQFTHSIYPAGIKHNILALIGKYNLLIQSVTSYFNSECTSLILKPCIFTNFLQPWCNTVFIPFSDFSKPRSQLMHIYEFLCCWMDSIILRKALPLNVK